MRVRRIFPAPYLYPSDTDRHGPIRVGMAGLRHKSRHKEAPTIAAEPESELSSREGGGTAGTSLSAPQHNFFLFLWPSTAGVELPRLSCREPTSTLTARPQSKKLARREGSQPPEARPLLVLYNFANGHPVLHRVATADV